MIYEKSTDRAWHVLTDGEKTEYLGSINFHGDDCWRFKPSVYHNFSSKYLIEISIKINELNDSMTNKQDK